MSIIRSRKIGCEARSIAVAAVILASVFALQGLRPGRRKWSADATADCALRVRPVRSRQAAQRSGARRGLRRERHLTNSGGRGRSGHAAYGRVPRTVEGNDAVIEVIVGQGRLVSLKADVANEQGMGVIAVATPPSSILT